MNIKSLGNFGEQEACQYLQGKGYQIVDKNFRNKLGEIDLIAKDRDTLCFIEVKTRKSLSYGAPYESVHLGKRRKMIQVALSYLKFKFHTIDVLSRFDVISIYQDNHGQIRLEHLVNAFDLSFLNN